MTRPAAQATGSETDAHQACDYAGRFAGLGPSDAMFSEWLLKLNKEKFMVWLQHEEPAYHRFILDAEDVAAARRRLHVVWVQRLGLPTCGPHRPPLCSQTSPRTPC